ncbi:MAG TPA: UrcA family protein [Steroidobacteraceae bacterium]|nr:UrcA family protein [Steroidobacteraceae bacterium]
MNKMFVLAATALLAGGLISTAHATTTVRRGDMQQEVVSFGDLNLDTESGAATLLGRIESAARKVCGLDRVTVLPLALQYELQVCANQATARAVNDVNAPLLTRRQIVVRNDQ